jgi:hypothetical protein
MVNERRWLIAIFALYFFLAIGYSLLMPPWEAPDEPAHYHLAWHLTYYNKYPSQEANYEAHQPRIYYYFASVILRALNRIDSDLTWYSRPKEYVYNIRKPEPRFEWNDKTYRFLWGMYILRWINIVFGGSALWLNWKTFKLIAPEKITLCLSALALAALTPQYLHIMSSVNNDAIATLAGALLFYLTIRSVNETSKLLSLTSIILAVLLPFLTKLSVLPVSAAVLLIIAANWIFRFTEKRWLVISAFLLLAVIVFLYVLLPQVAQTAVNEIKWRLLSFRDNAFTEKHIKFISEQILATYWGKVGWLAVGLPTWIIKSLTALGLIGMILSAYVWVKNLTMRQQSILWMAVWLIAILAILAVFRNGLTTRATQGRLLFPAIGAISLLMTAGWHEILPPRAQHYLPALIVLLFFCCNMVLWLAGILPVYYQPFLD